MDSSRTGAGTSVPVQPRPARLRGHPSETGGFTSPFAWPSRPHWLLIMLVSVVYASLVAAVATTSPLVALDWRVMLFRPYRHWPGWWSFMTYYVVLGQRGPTATIAAAWLMWRCRRTRTLRPLLVL